MPSLADILAAEAAAVSAFISLLHQEQDALKAGNADALPAIVEKKTATAMQIGPISSARNAELAKAWLPGNRVGMERWLEKHPADTVTRQAWQHLTTIVAEAQELSRINGELIRLRMAHNAQMLEILLAANRQDFYGADGQTSSVTTRRIIDSA